MTKRSIPYLLLFLISVIPISGILATENGQSPTVLTPPTLQAYENPLRPEEKVAAERLLVSLNANLALRPGTTIRVEEKTPDNRLVVEVKNDWLTLAAVMPNPNEPNGNPGSLPAYLQWLTKATLASSGRLDQLLQSEFGVHLAELNQAPVGPYFSNPKPFFWNPQRKAVTLRLIQELDSPQCHFTMIDIEKATILNSSVAPCGRR